MECNNRRPMKFAKNSVKSPPHSPYLSYAKALVYIILLVARLVSPYQNLKFLFFSCFFPGGGYYYY